MTHEAIQESTSNREAHPVPPKFIGPLTLVESQEIARFNEERHFLGILATDLVVSVGVARTTEQQLRVAENFYSNVELVTPEMSVIDRQAFALHLVETAEGKVKTDTAAHLKANYDDLLEKHEKIKQILMTKSVDILSEIAPFLKPPAHATVDIDEFKDELVIPSTAELEAQLEHVTDETVSPARGIALGFAAVQRYVVDPIKKGWDHLV